MQSAPLPNNSMPIHKFIPIESLELNQSKEVRILYYQTPARFYLYLREKLNSHALFQVELQRAMQSYQSSVSPVPYQRYQPVVAQDNHAVWHRATVLEFQPNSPEIFVYFVDFGQEAKISITNIRPLPQEFIRQPAFAIPCRLYQIFPRDSDDQSAWQPTDPVHDEFYPLTANISDCRVCDIKDQICYDVDIEITEIGDLGRYLLRKNLVTRLTKMKSFQSLQPSTFERGPPGFPVPIRPLVPHPLQKPTVRQSPSTPVSMESLSSGIPTFEARNGHYIITHVYSALEFYGYSQIREKEFDAFHQNLDALYNTNQTNDQSLSVHFLMEGVPCAIQQGEKYYRVVIKHRESESRVLVKLIDRGDEMLVDTSELLQLEKKYVTVPAFVQPFRLLNYDESLSTTIITRKLKRSILNQRVHITIHKPQINGFHQVEVKLADDLSLTELLLSNDPYPIARPLETQTVKLQQEMSSLRTTDDLPAPQKLLTAPEPPPVPLGRNQPGRFNAPELTSRFTRPQPEEQPPPTEPESTRSMSRGFSNDDQRSGNNLGNRNRFGNRNNEENGNDTQEQGSSGFNHRSNRGFATRGNRGGFNDRSFDQNNDRSPQQTTGFNDRPTRGGFQDPSSVRSGGHRNSQDEESTEKPQFYNRGEFHGERDTRNGGYSNFRGRGGGFGDNGQRGGYQNYRDRRGDGDNGQQENRGGRYPSFPNRRNDGDDGGRSEYTDRGGSQGGRGRGGGGGGGDHRMHSGKFGDRSNTDLQRANSDIPEPVKSFSGWPDAKPPMKKFEAGYSLSANDILQGSFQFVVSHIEEFNDFFIQLLSQEKEISDFNDTLLNEYSEAPEYLLNSIQTNQACLAKDTDDCWYRAIVLSHGTITTRIRFVDFGNTLDVDTKTIRQLAKKFCSHPSYAYRCTLGDVEGNDSITKDEMVKKCSGKTFNGKIEKKNSADKYLLQSDDLERLITEPIRIKTAPQTNTKCRLVHIDHDQHHFYIQDNDEVMNTISDKVTLMNEDLPLEDVQFHTMVISMFDGAPFRATIQSDVDNDTVKVYFVDYGNSYTCSKSSLKKCLGQLKEYPHQAKRCQLDQVPSDALSQAFDKLEEYKESDETEMFVVDQNDDLLCVRLYINGECFNDKYVSENSVDMDDQSSTTTTATTVKEQERPINIGEKRNNAEILSPAGNSNNQPISAKRQKSESESEVNTRQYQQATVAYVDKTEPVVFLQRYPDADTIIANIEELIGGIVQENKKKDSYAIGDHVIAQFSEDNLHYRARIESHSDSKDQYTIYFLDFGNVVEDASETDLFSYSDELEQIEAQAHRYTIDNFSSHSWRDVGQQLLEHKVNYVIEFHFIDESKSIIHVHLDKENDVVVQPKTFTANISATNKDCFYVHILPETDTSIPEMDELLQTHAREHLTSKPWQIDDLCVVLDKASDQCFRGKILSMNKENQYEIQRIDYGNILSDVNEENLYVLSDDLELRKPPLARQCRLFGVSDENQRKAVEEVLQKIDDTERVTMTVSDDRNDPCMYVMLFRENEETVNDQYRSYPVTHEADTDEKKDTLNNASDSAIAADDDNLSTTDILMPLQDQDLTSPIGKPTADSTHQYGADTGDVTVSNSSPLISSISMSQTIDFGENDRSTTITDDIENDNQA